MCVWLQNVINIFKLVGKELVWLFSYISQKMFVMHFSSQFGGENVKWSDCSALDHSCSTTYVVACLNWKKIRYVPLLLVKPKCLLDWTWHFLSSRGIFCIKNWYLTRTLYCKGTRVSEPKKWLVPNFIFKGWEWCIWTITTIIHHQIWSADSTADIKVIQSSKLSTLRSTFGRVPLNFFNCSG